MSLAPIAWVFCLITSPDNSFREAYTLGPERLERHDDGRVRHSEAHSRISPDETYQKAFDKLQKSMIQAEKKVRCR